MMKKLLFAATAALAISSCTMQETDNVADTPREPIRFEAFVDKSTRAEDVTTSNLNKFYVYGKIFKPGKTETIDRITVTKLNDGSWYYRDILYWEDGAAYCFFATNNEHAAATGTSEHECALLVDPYVLSDFDLIAANPGSLERSDEPVMFKFKHVLAKLKFTFTNAYKDGHEIEIKDLQLAPAYHDGRFTWWNYEDCGTWSDTYPGPIPFFGELSFTQSGEDGTITHLAIPQQLQGTDASLKFTLVVDKQERSCTVNIPTDVVAEWEAGHTYSYKLTVKPETVQFEMAVKDWGSAEDADMEDLEITEDGSLTI